MDEHQKRVILENIHWLCENTLNEYQLNDYFFRGGFITRSEIEGLNMRRNRLEKNSTLYNLVMLKENGNIFPALMYNLRSSNNHIVANFLENKLKDKFNFKRKMSGATLEKFLIPHLTPLCTKTVNPGEVVRELLRRKFISQEESNFIMAHPDIFYRNAELYKFMRLKCNYEEMIRILRDTGNDKIADHLDSIPV